MAECAMAQQELTRLVTECAFRYDADLVAIGGADRFRNTAAMDIYPDLKSVICIACRVLRGSRRGIEEGSTFYQYSTVGVQTLEETVLPQTLLRVCGVLEDAGYLAIPQRRHQTVMAEEDGTNPEMQYSSIYRGRKAEKQLDFEQTALLCGLGERGLHGTVLTDDFGPCQRYAFILTDAVLTETPLYVPHLCDGCGRCVEACPGHALSGEGVRNDWQCAVYYIGANRSRNPFMPPDAYEGFADRQAIMDGAARFASMEDASPVLDATFFYPPLRNGYASSICGKACDTACYVHLEKQGRLTRSFRRPFRVRPEWKLED